MDNSSEGMKPKSTGFRGKRAKRKFGKNLGKKGQPGDRKATKQDLPQLRAELGLPPSANHAQICHASSLQSTARVNATALLSAF